MPPSFSTQKQRGNSLWMSTLQILQWYHPSSTLSSWKELQCGEPWVVSSLSPPGRVALFGGSHAPCCHMDDHVTCQLTSHQVQWALSYAKCRKKSLFWCIFTQSRLHYRTIQWDKWVWKDSFVIYKLRVLYLITLRWTGNSSIGVPCLRPYMHPVTHERDKAAKKMNVDFLKRDNG